MFGFIVAWSIIMCIVFDYRGITAFGGFLILPILCVALGYGICRVKYILSDNAQIKKQFLQAIYASIGLTAIIFILLFVGIFDLLSTLNYFIIFCIVALIAQTFIDLPALLLRNTPLSKN